MEEFIFVGFLIFALFGVAAPILAIAAFATTRTHAAAIRRLEDALRSLHGEFQSSRGARARPAEPARAPAPAAERPAVPVQEPPSPPEPQPVAAPAETPRAVAAAHAPSPAGSAATGLDRFERQVTSRWFVLLGAAALALGGIFLVREAIERGWLGPGVRVTLGFVAGIALVAAGEWIRRRFPASGGRADFIPPALSSAGFLCCYASVYAAGQLYGFLPPAPTFAALAAVSVASAVMAILHGPVLALLSLIGGFLTPALVTTEQPNGWILFGYLFALLMGSQAMVWFRGWIWMSWIALAGAIVWSVLWVGMPRDIAALEPLAVFVLAVTTLNIAAAPRIEPVLSEGDRPQAWYVPLAAGAAMALLVFGIVRIDDYRALGLGTLAGFGALSTYGARRHAALDPLAPLAGTLTVAAIALWHLPIILESTPGAVWAEGLSWGRHVPLEAATFLTTAAVFGAGYAAGGFSALWGAKRPILWAGLSAVVPLSLLIAAYWRIARFEIDLQWSTAALAVGAVALAMAGRLARYRDSPEYAGALAIYAAAVTGAITLAVTMALRDAWLSVALSLELPALAWIFGRLPVPVLRLLAGAVAAIVAARLAFNPDVLSYARASTAGEHWPVYGYGVPLAAVYLSWRQFARGPATWLDALLRLLAFGFAALLVAFEYRALLMLAEGWPANALLAHASYPVGWLSMAAGLTTAIERHNGKLVFARRALFAIACAHLVLIELLLFNPFWNPISTGTWPVVNALLLAYAAPAGLLIAFAWAMRPVEVRAVPFGAASFALLMGFAWVNLETRRAFQGAIMRGGDVTEAESYAYSVVWLAYAGVLLAGGLWQRSQALRIGSLIVVMAAVAKVFVVDMADLAGLWRVASFFGLGLCLVGIGFLYQRYVFVTRDPAVSPA
jgi:uncharacterized membrane protein